MNRLGRMFNKSFKESDGENPEETVEEGIVFVNVLRNLNQLLVVRGHGLRAFFFEIASLFQRIVNEALHAFIDQEQALKEALNMIEVAAFKLILGFKCLDVGLDEKDSDEAMKGCDSRRVRAREVIVHALVEFLREGEFGAGDEVEHCARSDEHEECDDHHRHDQLSRHLQQVIDDKFANGVHDLSPSLLFQIKLNDNALTFLTIKDAAIVLAIRRSRSRDPEVCRSQDNCDPKPSREGGSLCWSGELHLVGIKHVLEELARALIAQVHVVVDGFAAFGREA